MNNIHTQLQNLIERDGRSLGVISDEIGISYPTVRRILKLGCEPSRISRQRIASWIASKSAPEPTGPARVAANPSFSPTNALGTAQAAAQVRGVEVGQ